VTEELGIYIQPISPELPAGESIRYLPIWDELQDMRRQEDERLPKGAWQRAPVRADFRRLEELCAEILTSQSKDFQVVMWLLEAWTMQHGSQGFCAGLRVLDEMIETFWSDGHPAWSKDDFEARESAFVWFATEIPEILKRAVWLVPDVLTEYPVNYAQFIMYRDYQRKLEGATEITLTDGEHQSMQEAKDAISTAGNNPEFVMYVDDQIDQFLLVTEELAQLSDKLSKLISADGPSIGKVINEVERVLYALASLKREAHAEFIEFSVDELLARKDRESESQKILENFDPEEFTVAERVDPPTSALIESGMSGDLVELDIESISKMNRARTYAALTAIAEHLQRLEPHSPTPYLLMRAVRWGKMSLTDVLEEIKAEGGDIERVLNLLMGSRTGFK